MTVLSNVAGGGQAGEVVLWDAPCGVSCLLLFSRAGPCMGVSLMAYVVLVPAA